MSTVDKFGGLLSTKKSVEFLRAGSCRETFPRDTDGNYDAENKRIKRLQNPIEMQDATNKQWVEQTLHNRFVNIKEETGAFDFSGKSLKNIGEPQERYDAATINFVKQAISKLNNDLLDEIKARTEGLERTMTGRLNVIKTDVVQLRTLLEKSITSAVANDKVTKSDPSQKRKQLGGTKG